METSFLLKLTIPLSCHLDVCLLQLININKTNSCHSLKSSALLSMILKPLHYPSSFSTNTTIKCLFQVLVSFIFSPFPFTTTKIAIESCFISTPDGTTLHVIVFEPSQETTQIKSNAIVLVHPYSKMGGSRTLVHGIASRLSIKGFTTITFDMRSVGRSTGVFLMVLLKFRCRCCLYSGLLKVASKQDFEGRFCRYGFDPRTIDFEMVKTKGNIVFDVLFDVSVNMCSSRC